MSHRLHRNGRGSQHQTGEPSMASQSNSVSCSKSRKRRRKDESAQNSEAKRSRLSRSSPTGNTRTGNTKKVAGPGVKSSGKGTKEPSLDDSSQRKLHEFINKDEQPRLTPSRKRSSPGDSTSMEGVKRTRLEESFERSSVNKDNQKQKTVHTNRSKPLTSEQHADSNAAGTVTEKTTMGTSSKQATNAASADITPSESQEKQVEGEPSKTDKQNRYDRKAEHQTEQATTKPDKEKKKRKRAEQNPAPGKPRGPGNLKRKSVPKKVRRRSTPGKHRECRKRPIPKWQKPITDFPLSRTNVTTDSMVSCIISANCQETQQESSTKPSTVTVSEAHLQSTVNIGEVEPSSLENNNDSGTEKSSEKGAKLKQRRRRRCRKCENCRKPDCGVCNNCRCVVYKLCECS